MTKINFEWFEIYKVNINNYQDNLSPNDTKKQCVLNKCHVNLAFLKDTSGQNDICRSQKLSEEFI